MSNEKQTKRKSPCDYCSRSIGASCPVISCYEFSRFSNKGTAPYDILEMVEDYREPW